MYQVIEHAGMDNETVVFENQSYAKCDEFVRKNYEQTDIDELGVDILKDGSTEY